MKVSFIRHMLLLALATFGATASYGQNTIPADPKMFHLDKFFFDKGKLIIVINGFQKKTIKTPNSEIDKALKIKKQYFDEK